MNGDEPVQTQVAEGSEGAEQQLGDEQKFNPGELFQDEAQRDAIIGHVMQDEGLRKQAFDSDEGQSVINRTADARIRPQLAKFEQRLDTIASGQTTQAQTTQQTADEATIARWNGQSAEERLEQMTTDMPLQVAEAKKRLGAEPAKPAETQGNGAQPNQLMDAGNQVIWAIKADPAFEKMPDAEFQQMVNETAASIDPSGSNPYGDLVTRLYERASRSKKTTEKQGQEAASREQNNEQRQTQGRPITGGQRGAATGTIQWFEEKLAKEGNLPAGDWEQYTELRAKAGMG